MGSKLISTSRVWATGGSPVVTVPKNIRRILGLEIGDAIIIDWGEIIKKSDMSKKGLDEIEEHKKKSRISRKLNKKEIKELNEDLPEL